MELSVLMNIPEATQTSKGCFHSALFSKFERYNKYRKSKTIQEQNKRA